MSAITAGTTAFVSAFNERQLVPTPTLEWDSYQARIFRYDYSAHYYHNTVYTRINRYAAQLKSQREIYKYVRGIYNPVQRLTETYVSKCYGGPLDMEKLTKGAISIAQADDQVRAAIRQLWLWSNWATAKSIYVRNGAMKGDTAIKIVDDVAAGKVRMEVIDPAKIKEVRLDEIGNIKEIIIEYQVQEEVELGKTDYLKAQYYLYTEIINEEKFQTLKNNEAYPFYNDANGTPTSEWPNPYGFVPVVKAQHRDMGFTWGANAWNGTAGKVDEINDSASLLNDQIRKAVNVIWYYAGVQKKDELTTSTDKKDQTPAIYGPANSQPFPMVAPIDISAAGNNIQEMLMELERDMPELALHRLRETGHVTAPGVKAAYSDAIDRIMEARGNYNDALVRAQMMALSIGGFRRYKEFEPFSLQSYANGDLAHYIGERPVIDDDLSKQDKITNLLASGAPSEAVWSELGYSEDQINEWKMEQQRQSMMTALMQRGGPQQLPPSNGQPNQPAQLPSGVKGQPLPSDQATAQKPITPEDVARWNAMFEGLKGITANG